MSDRFFPYERDRRWSVLLLPLRLRDDDGVTLSDDALLARYGRWSVETPLTNVAEAMVTGPHRWYTAVGLCLSFSDDGITFGTNHHRGVCIAFHDKVHRVIGPRDHSALWVSVADPDGLVAALVDAQR